MSPSQNNQESAGEYGREALQQWRDAIRYGARAIAERKKDDESPNRLRERLPSGELGELADATLAKFGKKGKLAAKAGVGSRLVDRYLGSPEEEAEVGDEEEEEVAPAENGADAHFFDAAAPLPIQESIDVAVPVIAVFDLATRFEELANFSERISEVEVEDETHLTIEVKAGGRHQTLALEIVGEEPEERFDWECAEGIEHTGLVTFHPLAPRLTRVELTIERESEGTVERLLRLAAVPEREIRRELRRFKAYAELWDEANDYKSADFKGEQSDEEAE